MLDGRQFAGAQRFGDALRAACNEQFGYGWSFSEVDARIGEVCFAPINGLRESGLSGPKSAKKRRLT